MMSDMHIKVFKVTKENISKKFGQPDTQLNFIPQFRMFMKQREPYNNYLHNKEVNQKLNTSYPVTPSTTTKAVVDLNIPPQPAYIPRISSEPSPLTNQFLKQQDNQYNTQPIKVIKEEQPNQLMICPLFPANFNKQQDENVQSTKQGKRSFLAIHSRSLNSKQQQQNSTNQFKRQTSPKISCPRNSHLQNDQEIHPQSTQLLSTPNQALFVHSHPQLKQTKILQINNCFKIQSNPLQNNIILKKIESQNVIARENHQVDNLEGDSFEEFDKKQKRQLLKSASQKDKGLAMNQVYDNQFTDNHNPINLSQGEDNNKLIALNSTSYSPSRQHNFFKNDNHLHENSVQEFMSKRNLFIGNNICNIGRPQSSKLFNEQRHKQYPYNQQNVSIPTNSYNNKFIIKGLQVKKS